MSKDRYSDDHTIETIGQKEGEFGYLYGSNISLLTEAGGTLYLKSGGGTGDHDAFSGGVVIGSGDTGAHGDMSIELRHSPSYDGGGNVVGVFHNMYLYSGNSIRIGKDSDENYANYIYLHSKEDAYAHIADGQFVIHNDDTASANQILFEVESDYADPAFTVDAEGDVFCAGSIDGDSLTVTGAISCGSISVDGQSFSDIIDWSDINPDSNINFNGESGMDFNINLLSGDFSMVTSGATSGADIFAPGEVGVGSGIMTYIDSVAMIKIGSGEGTQFQSSAPGAERCAIVAINAMNHVTIATDPSTQTSDQYVLKVHNEGGGGNSDGIQIDLNSEGDGGSTAGSSNNWIQFEWDGDSMGAIQGASESGSTGLGFWGYEEGGAYVAMDGTAAPMATDIGNVQFVSGTADFGEFFEAGNTDEWLELGASYDEGKSVNILGLREGVVVWVHEAKFYKEKKNENSFPMFVTKRAIIVGDGTAMLKGHPNNTAGEVLSFIGKLPVLVKGSVNSGDFLIPVDNESYCVGMSKENTSLKDYFNAMGTALESCEDMVTLPQSHPSAPGVETDMKLVLCAVGVK